MVETKANLHKETRVKKTHYNNFTEHDFLRDLKIPLFSPVLSSREEKGENFKYREKNCLLESCSNIFFPLDRNQ